MAASSRRHKTNGIVVRVIEYCQMVLHSPLQQSHAWHEAVLNEVFPGALASPRTPRNKRGVKRKMSDFPL
jgi:hypothetical protein